MRRLSLLMLAVLWIVLLAACGAGTSSTGSATTAPAAEGAAPTEAAAVPTEAAAPTTAPVETEMAATAETGQTEGSSTTGLPDLGGRAVVIGTDAAYPPFESVDTASNEIVGFDVDLMNEIGKLINIKPQFQNAAFDTIFAALQQKQFDAVMSAATITEERKKIIAFSEPYIEVGQLVVTLADNTSINSYQDLANAPAVGVQTGTTGEEAAKTEAKVPDEKLKRYQTIDLAFADLANNSIDAVVADSPTVGNYTSQPQYADKLKIVGDAFTTESYGIAVQQGDTELLNGINAALVQLKSNGTIQQLKDKHQIK